MSKTDGRPVRPGEVPAFGSVWTWGAGPKEPAYIVLYVEQGDLHFLDAGGRVDPYPMRWAAFGATDTLPQWRCVDEGPK